MSTRPAAPGAAAPPGEKPCNTSACSVHPGGAETHEETYGDLRLFLADLAGRGVRVELVDGGKVRVLGWTKVTDPERERLKADRDAIVALLRADTAELKPAPRIVRARGRLGVQDGSHVNHRGEPRPTIGRPFSRAGMRVLNERMKSPLTELITDAASERRGW